MAKNGRPTKYKEEYIDQVFKLCLLGLKDEELASYFEVSEATFNNWKIDHPDFLESIKAGREDADAEVSRALYNRARGVQVTETRIEQGGQDDKIVTTTKELPADTRAAEIWLRNRQMKRWNTKQDVNLSGDGIEFHLHVPEPKE